MSLTLSSSAVSAVSDGPRARKLDEFTLLSAWVAFNLLFGSLPLGTGLYASQFVLIALCALVVGVSLLKADWRGVTQIIGVMLVAVVWCAMSSPWGNPRFGPEFLKALLLIVPALLLVRALTWRDLDLVCGQIPLLVAAVLVVVLVSGFGFYYGDEGRFGVPWWGSPNNTGFVIAVALAMLAYRVHRRRQRQPRAVLWPHVLLGLVLAAFLVGTQSFGGLLSALVVAMRFGGLRIRTIFAGFAALITAVAAAAWLVPAFVLPELIGSGRLIIWQVLIEDLTSAGPVVWLVGRGPGAIDLELWFTASVQSAHSMYVEALYAYGTGGLLALVIALRTLRRRLGRASANTSQSLLLEALFAALVVGFFVDTYLMTAQLTWLGALLLAVLGMRPAARWRPS